MPIYAVQRVSTVSDEYRDNIIMGKSNHSYGMNQKITALFHKNSWIGRRCFIIGGGESLRGFNFNKLAGELTIGINKAFRHFQNSTLNYFMDSTFPDTMRRGDYNRQGEPPLIDYWNSYKGIKVFVTPMERKKFEDSDNIYLVRRTLLPSLNREDLEYGICPGINSGTGAIALAVALGCQKIFLLGYDMKCEQSTHWHDGYEQRNMAEFSKKLGEYRADIETLVPLLKRAEVEVINLNSNSELRCFPFADIDIVLGRKNANI